MNCKLAQRLMLLEESGEIQARRLQRLEKHLAGCRVCRDVRAADRMVMDAVRTGLPSAEPGAAVLARIRAEAAARGVGRELMFMPAMPRLLAYAALFVALLAGAYALMPRENAASRIEEVGAITAMMGHEPEVAAGDAESLSSDEQLAVLARQLLSLEDLQPDETSLDDLVLPEESLPTDLQSRNASAYRPA